MIVTVVGARPQFVKAAVLSSQLKLLGLNEFLIHTGQHYDYKMSEVFFSELGLPGANINLNIGSFSHGEQTARMLAEIEKILIQKKSEISTIVVFGDTNSTLAAALAASKLEIPVAHVEAGLRSYNRSMPEEINRVITDHLSNMLFCSSEIGSKNLQREGITNGVYILGDIMLDAFNRYSIVASSKFKLTDLLPANVISNYFLLTVHRPVNTDNIINIHEILTALSHIRSNIVWPVHPRTRKLIQDINVPSNVHMFDPFSYFEMLVILRGCKKVLTDSGGLQKEAYWAKKPCVTLRSETEWVETLHNSWNVLTEIHTDAVLNAINREVEEISWIPLYGSGDTSERIAKILKDVIISA